jgi:c(7)-type cytochrome triheme protein
MTASRRGWVLALFFLMALAGPLAHAEFGDVVLNNFSDATDIRPVIFPHWFHRVRYACKTCHSDLGFTMKAGGSRIDMLKIMNGEYCGACHNGRIAWNIDNCDLCHSAKQGTPTQVHKSTVGQLLPSVAKTK